MGEVPTVWGFDYGTTNLVLARVAPDGGFEADFLKLDPKETTRENYRKIQDLISSRYPLPPEGVFAYVEHMFFGKSLNVHARMTRVKTLLELILETKSIPFEIMATSSWKKEICGKSNIGKEEAQRIASHLWDLEGIPKNKRGHMLDALCIAETGRRWQGGRQTQN